MIPIRRLQRIGRLALAPVAAAAAAILHFSLNVPDQIPDGPTKQTQPEVARARPRPRPSRPARVPTPRTEAETAQLRLAWSHRPWSEEPVDASFARRAQTVVRRAFVTARNETYEGSPDRPDIVLTRVECHTIRCRFSLQGGLEADLGLVVDAMRRMRTEGDHPVWHAFEVDAHAPDGPAPSPGKPPEPEPGPGRAQIDVEVDLHRDGIDPNSLRLPAVEG